MKAIILAAGIGSRLRPMTNKKPKTLVEVNRKPMLKYIIDSLMENHIIEIVVCTGFESREIINFCKTEYPLLNFTFVENHEFETTNNLYTLYLAREHLNEDVILMNADIVYESSIIGDALSHKDSVICVDNDRYLEESMKVTVRTDGTIRNISKLIDENESYGCSIDIYKFNADDVKTLADNLIEVIERKNHRNEWTETLLDTLMNSVKMRVYPMNINGRKWYEIDNYEDLLEAETLFNPLLEDLPSKSTYILDLDGTLSLGDMLIEGARDFIKQLTVKNKNIYIMTNNSSKTPDYYMDKLINLGLSDNINVISSLDLAIQFFREKNLTRIYWVANKEVDAYLASVGLIYDDKSPQGLLLTYDTDITYNKLLKLTELVHRGLPYYATHTDVVCPTELGYSIPDIGTFIELIRLTSGFVPQKTFGKPGLQGIQYVANKDNIKMSEMVMIGDRLYTDILMTKNTDITSVLVLSGETTRDMYEESEIEADIIMKSIYQLKDFI
ncbi:HAD-IIA family hydrolase [Psychrobacillus sp. OK032]|uniref:HAD-IIA family hydrolase n=1 Tax=Psychrobacillus sp. OK032 TaxID=1884358 RepID=UPI0008D69AB8|nr:HAD-IIA family hydrolase [Psychrobacillus sp. OK032]SER65295.1 Haloacid Dehalogenase Superfamily Class (subfamily) IIA [Psychrobacillus sp. OK032]